jgi:hypothetical protein
MAVPDVPFHDPSTMTSLRYIMDTPETVTALPRALETTTNIINAPSGTFTSVSGHQFNITHIQSSAGAVPPSSNVAPLTDSPFTLLVDKKNWPLSPVHSRNAETFPFAAFCSGIKA